jgi:hypothetical protein
LNPLTELVSTIEPPRPPANIWGTPAFTVFHTPDRFTSIMSCQWLAIRRSWTVLDVSVKTQRFQADNRGWLTDDIDISLQHKLDRGGNPLTGFSDIHDRQGPDKENPPMGSVPHWICKYSRGTRTEFAQQVAGATRLSPPYTLNADTYINSAVQARMFLEELKKCIDDAEDDDGRPGSCRATRGGKVSRRRRRCER